MEEKRIREKVDKISVIQQVIMGLLLITMVFYPILSWLFHFKAPRLYILSLLIEGLALIVLAGIKVKIQISNFAKYYKDIYLSEHPDRKEGLEKKKDKRK